MKRIWTILLSFCLVLILFGPTPVYAAQADVRMNVNPVQTSSGDTVLEIDVAVVNGGVLDSITYFEITFNNQTIASTDRIQGGNDVFLRSSPLGTNFYEMPSSFQLMVYYMDFDGTPMERSATVYMPSTGADISFTRTAASNKDQIKLTYTVKNTGNVALVNLTISDEPTIGRIGTIDYLEAGQSKTLEHDLTLTKDVTSSPVVSYYASGSSTPMEKKLEALELKYNMPKLSIVIKADLESISAGDKVTLTYNVTNEGNVDFTNATISDPTLGTIEENISIEAGKMKNYSKIIQPGETTEYVLTVNGKDANGNDYSAKSNSLKIEVMTPTVSKLEISAATDRTDLSEAGNVSFNVTVRNTGETTLSQVAITDEDGDVYSRISSMEPGELLFPITIHVAETTVFTFKVEGLSPQGETVSATSSPLEIKVPLLPDGETLPSASPSSVNGPSSGLSPWILVLFIFILLLILSIIVVLVMLQVRARRRASANADDEFITQSQYTQDRYNNYSTDLDEEARAEISQYAAQYGPQRKAPPPRPPVQQPYAPAPLDDDENEPTVYKAQQPKRREPRTRQDFGVK